MSKMVIRWIKETLEDGPLTAAQIMDRMTFRRNCPTMNELGNYLSKNPEFIKSLDMVHQHYMTGGQSYVAVWKLRR